MKPYLLSAKQLVDKVKKSELSSVEVANSFIERIEEFEKNVHAWAFFDKTSFLEKAREADDWRLSGKPLGPLHGLPIAIKDIFKTDKGKYISPAPIELELSKNTNIEQLCIVGMGIPQPIILIVPTAEAKRKNKKELSDSLIQSIKTINPTLEKHENIEMLCSV